MEKIEKNKKKYIVTERPNLFEPNVYICFQVEFEKAIPVESMVDAVKRAFMANETTMSKVVFLENGAAYYEKMEQSGCKVIQTEEDFKRLITENEKKPFALNQGEMMRVFVQEKGRKILLMAHHLVGDGMSLVLFLKDILHALVGEELVYKTANVFTKEQLQKSAKLPWGIKTYVSYLNRKWNVKKQIYTWAD